MMWMSEGQFLDAGSHPRSLHQSSRHIGRLVYEIREHIYTYTDGLKVVKG